MKILFIGDIVGRVGRRIVKEKIPYYVKKYGIDFIIANGENATHGKGLIQKQYEELIDAGIDVITLGNHFDSKTELRRYIDRVDRLIRPLNILENYPGDGSAIYDLDGISIRVTNLLGSAFMDQKVNDPYYALLNVLNDEESATIHIIDFHAEATGEKISFAHALDGKVTAVIGTHTHVQTSDAQVLSNGTAFISDVGMCGYHKGVLGFTKESVVDKIVFGKQSKFQTPDEGEAVFSAVVIDVDEISGLARDIFSIYFLED